MVPRQVSQERDVGLAVGPGPAQDDPIVQADEIPADRVDPEEEASRRPGLAGRGRGRPGAGLVLRAALAQGRTWAAASAVRPRSRRGSGWVRARLGAFACGIRAPRSGQEAEGPIAAICCQARARPGGRRGAPGPSPGRPRRRGASRAIGPPPGRRRAPRPGARRPSGAPPGRVGRRPARPARSPRPAARRGRGAPRPGRTRRDGPPRASPATPRPPRGPGAAPARRSCAAPGARPVRPPAPARRRRGRRGPRRRPDRPGSAAPRPGCRGPPRAVRPGPGRRSRRPCRRPRRDARPARSGRARTGRAASPRGDGRPRRGGSPAPAPRRSAPPAPPPPPAARPFANVPAWLSCHPDGPWGEHHRTTEG